MRISTALIVTGLCAQSVFGWIWCTFHENSDCTGTQSVSFKVTDDGCFKAAGKSMSCSGVPDAYFKLVQSPNNNINCNCQNHCENWSGDDFPPACKNLLAHGFNPKFHTYRFVSGPIGSVSCGPNNCNKRDLEDEVETSSRNISVPGLPWRNSEVDDDLDESEKQSQVANLPHDGYNRITA